MHRARPAITPPDRGLVDALCRPDAFDHPVTKTDVVETHISWVILTDEFAYKIKKPIVLDFLDFGTLARRKHFCEEELRLNQPFAPWIYLDVVPIVDVEGRPFVARSGTPIEYALRMRRFDQEFRLDRQLAGGKLTVEDMRELGEVIAVRHAAAATVPAAKRAKQHATTIRFMQDNLAALEGYVARERLQRLSTWTQRELETLDAVLFKRFDSARVRECHGDLHLGNIVRLPRGITTFDCIEFDPELREIDVFADVGFLLMDLVAHDRNDLAAHFLNRYLEQSGDYGGVAVLDLFFVYRCLVRAKVAAISSQESDGDAERAAALAETGRYCDIAESQTVKPAPVLILMHGVSGSGKTWLSGRLMAALPAIRIRSDVERRRIFGLDERAASRSGVDKGIYTEAANAQVYERLTKLGAEALAHGHSVILDAAFLGKQARRAALAMADRVGCPAIIVKSVAPDELLRRRIIARSEKARDASEAGLSVLEHQLATREPLSAAEKMRALECDTREDDCIARILRMLEAERTPAVAGDQHGADD